MKTFLIVRNENYMSGPHKTCMDDPP